MSCNSRSKFRWFPSSSYICSRNKLQRGCSVLARLIHGIAEEIYVNGYKAIVTNLEAVYFKRDYVRTVKRVFCFSENWAEGHNSRESYSKLWVNGGDPAQKME